MYKVIVSQKKESTLNHWNESLLKRILSRFILGLFTPGHFMRFLWSDSYPILKRPGVNALRIAFETHLNPIAQTTSGGGLGRIPDETGQV